MLNIVLFGPPGSGKGTQSEKIIEKHRLVHLSTGDILRNEIKNETELGLKAEEIMKKGELVSDGIVIEMIRNKIAGNEKSNGFIFDGFPRTVAQAEALDGLMKDFGHDISGLISLEVEKDELVKRLVKRGEDSGRLDDTPEVIEKRITVYNKQTSQVASYYEKQGKFFPVNGTGSIDEIFERIESAISSFN